MSKLTTYTLICCFSCIFCRQVKAQTEYFVELDATTGAFDKISHFDSVRWVLPPLSAYDQNQHRYFFCGAANVKIPVLYTVDARTGSVLHQPVITAMVNMDGNVANLIYHEPSDKLYGIHSSGPEQKEYFISIDYKSGTLEKIKEIPGVFAVTVMAAVDSKRQRYIFIGKDTAANASIFAIDISTGDIALKQPVGNVDQLHYDAVKDKFFGLYTSVDTPKAVVSVDPETLQPAIVANLSRVHGHLVWNKAYTYDEANSNYIFLGVDTSRAVRLFTVDVMSSAILSDPLFPYHYNDSLNVICFQYDNALKKLFAIHWEPETRVDIPKGKLFHIYPNPFAEYVNIDFNKRYNNITILLYDAASKFVTGLTYKDVETIQLPRNDIASGVYTIVIYNGQTLLGDAKVVAN